MSAESRITVGLLHPGEMGAAVGTTVVAGGMPCLWASAARSAATRARAREVGLEDAGTLEAVVRASRVILSVVPPHGAADLARAGFTVISSRSQAICSRFPRCAAIAATRA